MTGKSGRIQTHSVLLWGQLWNREEMHPLVTFITEHKSLMFPGKEQQRSKRKIQKTEKQCLQPALELCEAPFPPQLQSMVFSSYAMPSAAVTSRELHRCQNWFASLGWNCLPQKGEFSGAGSTKLAENVSAQLQREPQAPERQDPEQCLNELPPAVLEVLCSWCASSRQRVLQGKVLGPVITKLGQKSFTCTCKNRIFWDLFICHIRTAKSKLFYSRRGKSHWNCAAAPFHGWLRAGSSL